MTTKWFGIHTAIVIAALWTPTSAAQTDQTQPTPRKRLNQRVADLQKNPSNDGLREKIIDLAGKLSRPTPPRGGTLAAIDGGTESSFSKIAAKKPRG